MGIIHVIDEVLTIPTGLVDTLSFRGYSTLVAALQDEKAPALPRNRGNSFSADRTRHLIPFVTNAEDYATAADFRRS